MKIRIEEAVSDSDSIAVQQEENGNIFLCIYSDNVTIELGITAEVLANIGNGLNKLLNEGTK